MESISLFHPQCQALAQADKRFTFGRDDFYAPSSAPSHVIRLMNALHPGLSDVQIGKALSAIHAALRDPGLLVVGSATKYDAGKTIFRRSEDGFVAIKTVRGGSFLQSTGRALHEVGWHGERREHSLEQQRLQ